MFRRRAQIPRFAMETMGAALQQISAIRPRALLARFDNTRGRHIVKKRKIPAIYRGGHRPCYGKASEWRGNNRRGNRGQANDKMTRLSTGGRAARGSPLRLPPTIFAPPAFGFNFHPRLSALNGNPLRATFTSTFSFNFSFNFNFYFYLSSLPSIFNIFAPSFSLRLSALALDWATPFFCQVLSPLRRPALPAAPSAIF